MVKKKNKKKREVNKHTIYLLNRDDSHLGCFYCPMILNGIEIKRRVVIVVVGGRRKFKQFKFIVSVKLNATFIIWTQVRYASLCRS